MLRQRQCIRPSSQVSLLVLSTVTLTLAFHCVCVHSQDAGFGFPVNSEEAVTNANGRKPLYIPSQCNENELLYPGDQKDDWICDCGPAQLYHPTTDKCFPAYRQGPCLAGQYLVLPRTEVVPVCATNPCRADGRVQFRNRCYQLNTPGPCALPQLGGMLGVNVTTMELGCLLPDLKNRFSEDMEDQELIYGICKGSKRVALGKHCVDY